MLAQVEVDRAQGFLEARRRKERARARREAERVRDAAGYIDLPRVSASSANYLDIELGSQGIDNLLKGAVSGNVSLFLAHLGVSLVSGLVSNHADQSGTNDANKNRTQATALVRPTFTSSSAQYAGRDCFTFTGTQYLQSSTWAASLSQPFTWYCVARLTDATTSKVLHFSNTAVNYLYVFTEIATGNLRANMGATLTSTTALNVTHVYCIVANGVSSAIYMSNVTTPAVTGNIGAGTSVGETLGATNAGAAGWVGSYAADGIWSGAHNATQRGLLMNIYGSYYGVAITP